jgi:hypothetical protein
MLTQVVFFDVPEHRQERGGAKVNPGVSYNDQLHESKFHCKVYLLSEQDCERNKILKDFLQEEIEQLQLLQKPFLQMGLFLDNPIYTYT